MIRIREAESEGDLVRCFPVVRELRAHLDEVQFLEAVSRQRREGYRVAYLECDGSISSVAGFRIAESLAWGRFLYVDDLVTTARRRSEGHGRLLLEWLLDYARSHGCEQLHLDSGVQRSDAHRFYMRNRLGILAYHFARPVGDG